MATGLKPLIDAINTKISGGGLSTCEISQLSGAICSLDKNMIYSVPNVDILPSAVNNAGRFIYVTDLGIYKYSNGLVWTDDFTTHCIFTSGNIYAWGENNTTGVGLGSLGDGTTVNKCSPVREISSNTTWCKISAEFVAVAIKSDGSLWSWGQGSAGALGDGTTVNKCSPVREISSSTNWSIISGSSAIKSDGSLWSWGCNCDGQTGDGTTVNRCSPVREISSSTNWCNLARSFRMTSAVKTDGTLWTWGRNDRGQLGNGATVNRCSPVREISSSNNWKQVATSCYFSAALKIDGSLWTWGCNLRGQLGNGTTVDTCSPVREISSDTTWCSFGLLGQATAAIKSNGSLWSWGLNSLGLLGDGTTVNKCSPVREISCSLTWCCVAANTTVTAAIKSDGSLWSWGDNNRGRLGNNNDSCGGLFTCNDRCSPVREISSGNSWSSLGVGCNFTIALETKTTGFNDSNFY